MHTHRHFDQWAKRYDRSWTQSLLFGSVQRSVVATLSARLPPSAAVLDIGCGTGRLLERIGKAVPDAVLIGLDPSKGMAEQARHIRPRLRIERGTAEALPHPARCFEAAVTTISFHHWSDKAAALSEVFRILVPGGLFALTDVSSDDLPPWPARLWAMPRLHMDDMPTLVERRRLIEDAGLHVIEERPMLHRRWIRLTLAERPAS
jgi:ubiquinone/menaquinone biosynthesis C-methylase UbiE